MGIFRSIGHGVASAGRGVYHGAGNLVDNITGENQANAARDAAGMQSNFGNRALDLQKGIYDQNAKNFQPYLEGGSQDYNNFRGQVNSGAFDNKAFNPVQAGNYEAPPAYQDSGFSLKDLANDPGYQFRLNQGINAVQNSAAGKYGLHGGATLTGINNYAQGFASNEAQNAFNRYANMRDFRNSQNMDQRNFGANQFNNNRDFNYGQQQDIYNSGVSANQSRFNNLSKLAGYGSDAANSLAGLGQNFANSQTSTLEGIGNSQAAGRIGAANAFGQGTQNILNGTGKLIGYGLQAYGGKK